MNAGETSTVEYISLQSVFILNVLKFELQYEWNPPQIFFYGYRVLSYTEHYIEDDCANE